ncbi:DNA-directed RNA polymerase I subunit RPA34.5-domain-containing protein [Annulohypoxylon truncatum]|uniref:DNA-directed RNA polymerase I subunit RPA34.5-domain-containing protein n=1 Tax=Annulohypoxylon truncatum TaxID=327061 RepID=UPI002008C13F|nr:DNA-directed RNA polymerase I subunit RPA34.5-domain-containing protein [Annulohypoxylon truncatum]KAI1210237.1 DNA-directed RNA polymerase I subunit RPA34.5-domain-containing protein [Annulohypoxylon truncatum]
MAKHRARVPIASLASLVSHVRDQKAATNSTPNSNKPQSAKKFAQASDSDASDDTSSDGSDESDSDSEVDIEAARKKYAEKQESKRKSVQQKPIPEKSQPTKSTPSANESSTAKAAKSVVLGADGSESEADSESDSDSQSSDSGDRPAQKTAANERTANKDDGGSESDTSSEDESEDEATNAQQPVETESSSDDDSESNSSDADEESTHDAMDVDGNAVAVNGNSTAQSSTSQMSRPAWIDNSNFVLRKASSDNPAKEVADFFNNTNLEGKQVWYFTAPASLPITVLKDMEIDLSKATTGEALLSHQGDEYGLDLESHATSTQIQLLIPSQGGDKYAALNRGIDSTVHLRRIAKFGPGGAVSATATDDYAAIPKAIREQPQGLKPRFTPIGVPTPTWQSVPSISAGEPKGSKNSKQSIAVNGQLKRKQASQEGEQPITAHEPQSRGKSAKRAKTSKSAAAKASSFKETPIQAPVVAQSSPAPTAIDTPSKVQKAANNDKAKTDKKAAFKPKKETPIPLPHVLSMNMKR